MSVQSNVTLNISIFFKWVFRPSAGKISSLKETSIENMGNSFLFLIPKKWPLPRAVGVASSLNAAGLEHQVEMIRWSAEKQVTQLESAVCESGLPLKTVHYYSCSIKKRSCWGRIYNKLLDLHDGVGSVCCEYCGVQLDSNISEIVTFFSTRWMRMF